MFNKAFDGLAKHPELDFAPEDLDKAMKEVDELVYPNINDVSLHPRLPMPDLLLPSPGPDSAFFVLQGVYRCGFAGSQEAYDAACTKLFDALEQVEGRLDKQR